MTPKPRLGFIGIGLMGEAMTLRLIERDWAVRVWNLTPDRYARVVSAGGGRGRGRGRGGSRAIGPSGWGPCPRPATPAWYRRAPSVPRRRPRWRPKAICC